MLRREDWEKGEGMATADQALVTKLGKPTQTWAPEANDPGFTLDRKGCTVVQFNK